MSAEAKPEDDEIIATLSDYLDNMLPPERQAEVEGKLASDETWKRVHHELVATRDMLSTLSDYLDGTIGADLRAGPALAGGPALAEIEHKIATDETWRNAHAELVETRKALSGLQRARAPSTFAQDVTATIHKRSAGRFFARRTFGDRMPFSALMVLALIGLVIIAYVLWASTTGSLRVDHGPAAHPTGSDVVPKP